MITCKDCGAEFERPSWRGPAPTRCAKCTHLARNRDKRNWNHRNPEYVKQANQDRAMLRRLDRAYQAKTVLYCEMCGHEIEWTMDPRAKRCTPCNVKLENTKRRIRHARRTQVSGASNRTPQDVANENQRVQVRQTRTGSE